MKFIFINKICLITSICLICKTNYSTNNVTSSRLSGAKEKSLVVNNKKRLTKVVPREIKYKNK